MIDALLSRRCYRVGRHNYLYKRERTLLCFVSMVETSEKPSKEPSAASSRTFQNVER